MTKRSIIKLLAVAEAYQKSAQDNAGVDPSLSPKEQQNQKFQAQRARLDKFGRYFSGKCRAILNELDGEIFTLRQRKFDPQMLELLVDIKNNIEYICKKMDYNNPYTTAYELVDYILDKPTRVSIENLEFLAKHHLEKTKPAGNYPPFAFNAEVRSLEKLLGFAYSNRAYMEANPMLHFPNFSSVPANPNPAADPDFLADPEEQTNAPAETKVLDIPA